MPYTRKYRPRRYRKYNRRRKSYRKNYYRKGKRSFSNSLSLTKFGTTVPDRIFVKLRYVERIVLTAGSSNSYVFRGNSIFDPNYTSTGGQALATDQWNSFYQQYRVHSSSIKVVINATGGGAGSVRRYLTLPWDSDDLSTINATPFSVVAEYPRAKVWYGNTNTGAGAVSMSKNFVKSYKALGLSKTAYNADDNTAAYFDSNPGFEWYWYIRSEAGDVISSPESPLYITMTYFVELFDRRALGAS